MISFRPNHLSRYASIARLLLKYRQTDLVDQLELDAEIVADSANSVQSGDVGPESLARDLEKMGPTFIKLGQLLSTRADFLPPDYLDALSRLQDDVEPLPFDIVEKTIESELGVRISKAFSEFEPVPLASASIGQVHRAALRDGRRVAVKVQRPHLRQQVRDDLDALNELAGMVDDHTQFGRRLRFVQIVGSLREVMAGELDYRQEAENARTLAANLSGFTLFRLPQVIDDYTSMKVITLEFIEGAKLTALSPMVLLEQNGPDAADQLFRIYLHQVLVDGVFHADPHPGNILLTPDRKLAMIDFGMVSRMAPELRMRLLKLLMALGDGRAEQTAQEAIAVGTPYKKGRFDEDGFRLRISRFVTENEGKPIAQLNAGRIIMEINAAAGETGLELPHSVIMLAKTLMNLDKLVALLDPEFNPQDAIRRHAGEIFQQQSRHRLSFNQIYQTLLESAEFVERLPERLNSFADLVAHNKLKVSVDAIDERRFLAGLQKIANRITSGLILAAMIVAASLMMHLQTGTTIFGYPPIALFFFLVAAIASCVLLWRIATHDETDDP